MATVRLNRAGQIARELNVLCDEITRLNRTTIKEAQALLEATYELQRLATRRLAEAEA